MMAGMSRIFRRWGIAAAIAVASAPSGGAWGADPPAIVAVTEELRPFNFAAPDGSVAGMTTALVRKLAETAKLSIEFRILPWNQAYAETLSQPGRLLYTTVRTPERETAFHWIGPIAARELYLVKLRSRTDIQIGDLDQARHWRVGAIEGDASATSLRELGWAPGTNLELQPPGSRRPIALLSSGTIDLVTGSPYGFAAEAVGAGLSPDAVELAWKLPGPDRGFYLALNPATDPAIIERLETAFRAMVESGEVASIMRPRTGYVAGVLPFAPWYMAPAAGRAAAGIMPDFNREIAARLGIEIDIAVQPNARLIQSLIDGTIDYNLGFDDPARRTNDLDCGVAGALEMVVVTRADSAIKSAAALEGRRLGMLRGVSPEPALADIPVEWVPLDTAEQGLRLVIAGRLDGALVAAVSLPEARRALAPEEAAALTQPFVVSHRPFHIWVSPASFLAARCDTLKAATSALNSAGTFEEILARYR